MSSRRSELVAELSDADRAYQLSVVEMNEAVVAQMGVTRSDALCLDGLDRLGVMRAGELARVTQMSSGAVTAMLDRLEKDGYVERRSDRHDGRRVLVVLTDRVKKLNAEFFDPVHEHGPWIKDLNSSDLRLLVDFLRYRTQANLDNAARIRSRPKTKRRRNERNGA